MSVQGVESKGIQGGRHLPTDWAMRLIHAVALRRKVAVKCSVFQLRLSENWALGERLDGERVAARLTTLELRPEMKIS